MLLAVSLTHLADPENAKAAYDQAINLDVKDPTVPLNFSVFLGVGKNIIFLAKAARQKARENSNFATFVRPSSFSL